MSIPARFREVLLRENHDRLYITGFPNNGTRYLALYPPSQWDVLNANVKSKPRFDPSVQIFEKVIFGGAHEVPVDRQGRILIPPKLRLFAALDRDVTFSAVQDHFQLWDKNLLEKVLKADEEKMMEPDFYAKLGL